MVEKIFIFVYLIVSSNALPQGYGSGNVDSGEGPECITRQKDVHEVVNKEEFRQICKPVAERVCETLTRRDCKQVDEQECFQGVRDECKIDFRDNCVDDFRDVPESYTEDECVEEIVNVCEKAWIEQGYNDKVWADDPSTCRDLPKTNCQPVQKTRNVKEKFTKCDKVPFQSCVEVPDTKCNTVKREKCDNVPYEDCKFVNRNECEEKHFQVPQQVTRQVAVRVCKNALGQFPEDPDPLVIETRTDKINARSEVQDENQISDDPDRIVFG